MCAYDFGTTKIHLKLDEIILIKGYFLIGDYVTVTATKICILLSLKYSCQLA